MNATIPNSLLSPLASATEISRQFGRSIRATRSALARNNITPAAIMLAGGERYPLYEATVTVEMLRKADAKQS